MKKDCPLVFGKWYTSTQWYNGAFHMLAKFDGVDERGFFTYSERVFGGMYQLKYYFTNADLQDWGSFIEVSQELLKKYLPKNHLDLKAVVHEIW